MTTGASASVLTDDLLARCLERAPGYDKENKFFQEDFDELKAAGYLNIAVPKELGGGGMNLAEVGRETRKLAYYAHATALALNMHIYWTGIAADLWRSGDKSLEWLLKGSVAGEVYAAAHAESGNDIPILLSTAKAEKVDGGYKFTGKKSFGSLSPVWTVLGFHGMDTSDTNAPKVVHAFMKRDTPDYKIVDNWDVMGMRATQSHDTVLEGAFIPDEYIARVVAPGAGGVDQFVLSLFAWALIGFGNVYYGLAQHAVDMVIPGLKTRTSLALSRPYAYHAEFQHLLADMLIELESIGPHLDRIAEDWSNGVDHGGNWPAKIVAAKFHAVEGAWKVVDGAMELGGGFSIFAASGMERLFRDARLGRIHPANAFLTREFVAKTALGINPDETPRWG